MNFLKNKIPALLLTVAAALIAAILILKYFPAYHRNELVHPQPPYKPATTCPELLLQYDDAISAWGRESGRSASDLESLNDRFIGGHAPTCPAGGKITLGTRELATTCSIHGMANDNRPVPEHRKLSFKERFSMKNLLDNLFPGSRSACIAQLKQMDGAAQQWALENKKTDSDLVDINATAQYLKGGQFPLCPAGGKYQFSYVSNPPVCTRAYYLGHSLP